MLFSLLFLLALATGFGVWIGHVDGHQRALEFASGYLIELSLSIDNLFRFLLMFRSFGLSAELQRKALLLGIVGAIVMRGLFIFAGIELLNPFAWIQYVFGALLVVAALRLLQAEVKRPATRPRQPSGLHNGPSAGRAAPRPNLPLRRDRNRAGRPGVCRLIPFPQRSPSPTTPSWSTPPTSAPSLDCARCTSCWPACSTGCTFSTLAWPRFWGLSASRCVGGVA